MTKSHSIYCSFKFIYKQNLPFNLEKSHQPFLIYIYLCTQLSSILDNYQLFEKSSLHIFLISTLANYVIDHVTNHVTSYLSKYTEHLS